jgi:hypothetical protein
MERVSGDLPRALAHTWNSQQFHQLQPFARHSASSACTRLAPAGHQQVNTVRSEGFCKLDRSVIRGPALTQGDPAPTKWIDHRSGLAND